MEKASVGRGRPLGRKKWSKRNVRGEDMEWMRNVHLEEAHTPAQVSCLATWGLEHNGHGVH